MFEDLHRRMDAWGQEECDVVICVEGKTPREVAWEVSDAVREFLERGDRGPAELPLRGGSIV